MICDFTECMTPAAKVLSNEDGPFGKLCEEHYVKVSEAMKSGDWNLLVDKHVHTVLSLVEKDPLESILGPNFVPIAQNKNGLVN